jgi:GAF domain-containing protein
MAYILEHKVPLAVTDAQTDPLLAPVHEVMRQRNTQSLLIVPIMAGGEVIGTLGFDAFQQRVFDDSDVDLVQHVASQVGQVR